MYSDTNTAPGPMPDAQNPAARAFAMMRIKQFFNHGLGGQGQMAPVDGPTNSFDPAAYWRQLSTGLGSDPTRLAQFQGQQAPAAPAGPDPGFIPPGSIAGLETQVQHLQPHDNMDPEFAGHSALLQQRPRVALENLAKAKAVATTMSHLRKLRPYPGPH